MSTAAFGPFLAECGRIGFGGVGRVGCFEDVNEEAPSPTPTGGDG